MNRQTSKLALEQNERGERYITFVPLCWVLFESDAISQLYGARLDETIYIADSKLINLPTLKLLMDVEGLVRLSFQGR